MTAAAALLLWHDRDEALARRLVAALEQEGLAIDSECAAACWGERARAIDRAIREAGCVVVLWSRGSTGPDAAFIRDWALTAKERGTLIGLGVESVLVPSQFEGMRLIDLGGWRGSRNNRHFRELVAAVRATQATRPPPAMAPAVPFYRRIGANLTVGGVAIGLIGFTMNLFGVQDEICAIGSGHAISDACGALGLGGQPGRDERLAFERLPVGNCQALQHFRPRLRSPVLKEEAARRLSAPTLERADHFTPELRSWRSYVRTGMRPLGTVELARADALARARQDATLQGCAPRDSFERLAGVNVAPVSYHCQPDPRGGFGCALDYAAECRIEARMLTERCR